MSRLIDKDKLLDELKHFHWTAYQPLSAHPCEFDDAVNIVTKQPTANDWIPVERELPKEEGEYLVTGKWGGEPRKYWICQLISLRNMVGWCNSANNPRVEAWKQIEPYTGDK